MSNTDTLGFAEPYVWHSCTDSGHNITLKDFVDNCFIFNNYIVKYKIKLLDNLSNFWMPRGQNQWWYEGFVFF